MKLIITIGVCAALTAVLLAVEVWGVPQVRKFTELRQRQKAGGQKMNRFIDVKVLVGEQALVLAAIMVVVVVALLYQPYMIPWMIAAVSGGL